MNKGTRCGGKFKNELSFAVTLCDRGIGKRRVRAAELSKGLEKADEVPIPPVGVR